MSVVGLPHGPQKQRITRVIPGRWELLLRKIRRFRQSVSAAWRVGATAHFQDRQRMGRVMMQNLIRYIRPSMSTDMHIHQHSRDASDLPE